eukprot:comp22583_c0_seq1/m.34573 comp22583_c0_seq1/g.34573  ORF comp22583_c0_seq1/g.34573 comp22583_c0_seq1/m.34573 type:complete len:191 (-) comp22583_c0_seq1:470-1042(-)
MLEGNSTHAAPQEGEGNDILSRSLSSGSAVLVSSAEKSPVASLRQSPHRKERARSLVVEVAGEKTGEKGVYRSGRILLRAASTNNSMGQPSPQRDLTTTTEAHASVFTDSFSDWSENDSDGFISHPGSPHSPVDKAHRHRRKKKKSFQDKIRNGTLSPRPGSVSSAKIVAGAQMQERDPISDASATIIGA